MRPIVNDWVEFCEKGKQFEDSYFYTLFMEDEINEDEIQAIFRSFPNSEELIKRMSNFLSTDTPELNNEEKQEVLGELIGRDFQERSPILNNLPGFSEFNEEYQIVFNRNLDYVEELILDDIWVQEFHDYMRLQKIITDKKVYELYNAFYGATYDPDYQLYLFIPLLNTNYSMEYLFKFKKAGGVYAITNSEVVYSCAT